MSRGIRFFLKELEPYRQRKARINPERSALLVIDVQNYFQQIVEPVLPNILRVIETCRDKGISIIFTQHGHVDPAIDGGMLGQWWGELIVVGTEEWRLIEGLNVRMDEPVVSKKRYSSFFGTDLDSILRSRGITELIISGVMTNLCCETTARDAFMRDYHVFFLIDGTATANDDLHMASLRNLGYGFAYLLTCDELIGQISGP